MAWDTAAIDPYDSLAPKLRWVQVYESAAKLEALLEAKALGHGPKWVTFKKNMLRQQMLRGKYTSSYTYKASSTGFSG